ncbi:hypothetical protein QJS83_07635 [Bdellovibrio sp. 22V]|uniref:hypothetical protein n=1 Tax=Bdellovibrio TaxID=958 RepID=UPI002543919C|nr:hypothetical protein [Bdellovibrio sp. 22V]WII73746.1 hypothetical protein QJS83_07635 [Bdellovibrio sp. 22V]
MDFIASIVFEFFVEIIIQVLFELGFHSIAETFKRKPNPFVALIGYAVVGAICGGLSLLIVRNHFVNEGSLRVANLILTPLIVGALVSILGARRAKKGMELIRLDKFSYGYIFAFAMALVRYFFAS